MNSGEKKRIYIVEDDDAVRDSFQAALSVYGYPVAGFASGEAFLAGADLSGAGCVVLDVNLPGMSGLEVLARIRGAGSLVLVVMVSGRATPEMKTQARRLGARSFFEKPTDIDELLAAIEAIDETETRTPQ